MTAQGTGTAADPWRLKTPPLSGDYTLYRDDDASPPLLVCQVGSTRLTYLARVVDDMHAMLVAHGDWIVAAGVHKLVPGQVVRPYESGPVSKPAPADPRDARNEGVDKRAAVRG